MFTRFSVFIFVISSFLLLNGCYTTTHRGPWTVKPGKISPSINYLWFKGTEADTDDDPMELFSIEGRIGLIEGLDIGYMRTIDISSYVEDEDDGADMHIFDVKYHAINTDMFDAALQFRWGNVLNLKDDDGNNFWMNMLNVSFGIDASSYRIFGNFTVEYLDDEWHPLPDWLIENDADLTFKDQTKQLTLGVEIPNNSGLYPVVEIGRMYSDDFSEGVNIFNAGVNYYLNQ